MKRNIIRIDQDKCDGCGLCVNACHEGAIQLINGKAKLVSESYCDGLGACLGECPRDAITIEEREADAFDPEHVKARMAALKKQEQPKKTHCACPGAAAFSFANDKTADNSPQSPQLRQWPVQLHLVSVNAPYWNDAHLLIAADCVPVAYADFQRLLRDKRLVIACPKLDDTSTYVDKLAEILIINNIKAVSVAFMEVPCCSALVRIVQAAVTRSGKNLQVELIKIGIRGEMLSGN